MDFELTDEQRLLQDTVRAFVDERILPSAVRNDIAHRLDRDAIAGMAELGILGIVIPEEYGGAGLDFVAEALACEEIERGEAAFRTSSRSTSDSTRWRFSGTPPRSRNRGGSSRKRAERSLRASA
jgi:alkylation response protein AidB-like acyl-CoA dehydrogenase